MKPFSLRGGMAVLLVLLVAACSLPGGPGIPKKELRKADAALPEFAVYQVTRALLPSVAGWPLTGENNHSWITRQPGPMIQRIAAGDRLDLTVWDSDENTLLASAGQKVVDLRSARVDASGHIFVPYLDKVRVAGMTPERAREHVQQELSVLIPSAQVQLTLTEGRRNTVDLVGGVGQPGAYPLPDRNFSVLSLLSAGGGVSGGLDNPQIRLMRDGRIYGTSVARLYAEPALDTTLRGSDKVIVEEDRRYFISLGATGAERLHPFTKDTISAMDAMAISDGLADSSANPKGILILREYPASALRPGQRGPRHQRVVFTLDLTSADGLFSARQFRIHPNDVVLATESPITAARTIFGLIGSAFGVVNAASNL